MPLLLSLELSYKSTVQGKFRTKFDKIIKCYKDWREASQSFSEHKNSAESKNTEISFNDLQSYLKDEIPQEIRDKIQSLFTKWCEAGSPENFDIKSTD